MSSFWMIVWAILYSLIALGLAILVDRLGDIEKMLEVEKDAKERSEKLWLRK